MMPMLTRIHTSAVFNTLTTDNVRQVSETTSKYTVFPALILVYTVIVTDQRKRNTLVNLGLVNLGFSWGVRREYLSDL